MRACSRIPLHWGFSPLKRHANFIFYSTKDHHDFALSFAREFKIWILSIRQNLYSRKMGHVYLGVFHISPLPLRLEIHKTLSVKIRLLKNTGNTSWGPTFQVLSVCRAVALNSHCYYSHLGNKFPLCTNWIKITGWRKRPLSLVVAFSPLCDFTGQKALRTTA